MKGTIKDKREIERLFRTGRRSSSSLMTVLAMKGSSEKTGACAFIAGKKLGIAPLRSRCKRVLRQVADEIGGPWDGYQVAFIAKRKIARAPHDQVVDQMRRQLKDLGIIG